MWFPVTEVNYWVSDTFFLLSRVSQKPVCYNVEFGSADYENPNAISFFLFGLITLYFSTLYAYQQQAMTIRYHRSGNAWKYPEPCYTLTELKTVYMLTEK
ncbi:hypothetical protein SAMN05428949_0914 [Chitinophaga sp. YR627]|nr:hypothetical protein SAMN05428949_0914 [Chitinophaga sp. YR627]